MRDRAYRRKMKEKKEKRLKNIITNTGSIYLTFYWSPSKEYIKYCKNSNIRRAYKKHSNRIIRKSDISYNGNRYRKCFDYWWNLI